jgi:hypothetical protein
MPPKLFRKQPPHDLYTRILSDLQITYHRWFSKEDLHTENMEHWLPELEAYYLPCKAKRFLHDDFSTQRLITVLRHLSPLHNVEVKSQERMMAGKKTTFYMLNPAQFIDLSGSNGEVVVDFL